MNKLTEERLNLANLLGEVLEIPAFANVPDRFVPPAVIAIPGTPYVESDVTFKGLVAHYEAWILVPTDESPIENYTSLLDDLVAKAVPALIEAGWDFEDVGEPFRQPLQNTNYLVAVLRVSTGIRFNQ